MLKKIIKIKLEENLIDFKKGKNCYLKRNAGSVVNRDISGPSLINKKNSD